MSIGEPVVPPLPRLKFLMLQHLARGASLGPIEYGRLSGHRGADEHVRNALREAIKDLKNRLPKLRTCIKCVGSTTYQLVPLIKS